MYKRLPWLFTMLCALTTQAYAQAPVISYSPSTDNYTVNSTITTLSPANTGGAVSNGALTTFENIPSSGQPYGIAYDPTTGNIITNSYAGGAVYVYSPSGTLLHTYTTDINTGGPKDIVVDNSGNIYVANPNSNDVVKITPAGVFSTITCTSPSNHAMNDPDGMAIDGSGNIYVADQTSDCIYKITPGATSATVYASGFTDLYGVTVNDATGQVYASEYSSSSVANCLYTVTSGSSTGGTTLLYTTTNASGSNFRNLSIDASGDLYVADEGLGKIIQVVPGTSQATTTASTFISGLTQCRATCQDVLGNIYIANSGGADVEEYSPHGYSINIPLPTGMSFNTTTGQISGTPTVTSPTTTYTIAAHNASGTGYTTVTITVYPVGPTTTGDYNCGPGIVNLSASGGLPAGGTYNWYTSSTSITPVNTGSTYNPSILATTTYYVDYTQGGVTCASRVAVIGTISNDPVISTAPTSGAYFSYGFTSGSVTDLSGSGNNGTVHGSPTTTADRYGISGNALSFSSASSQYISTSTVSIIPGPTTFSISVWFKTTTAGGYLVGYGSSQTGGSLSVDRVLYIGTNGELYFGVAPLGVKSTINSTTAYNDGNWHHAAVTLSAANGSNMYVDGALVASNPAMNAVLSLLGYWRVGYDSLSGWTNAPTTYYFNGALDDVAVANTELTYSGVATLYGAGAGTFCSGNTLSLTANTVAGATYSWVGPSGSGFTSSSQNPTVSASQAIAGIYTVTVTNSTGCSSSINVTAPGNVITYTWSGAAGTTSLTTAGNWDHLPPFTSSSNLVIPAGLTTYPALTSNISVFGLTLGTTAQLNLNGNTISVGCNIINNASTSGDGILYGNNTSSGITWNGSVAAQSYTGTNTATTAELGNMTVNNSAGGTVTISGGPIDIFNLLTITQGNLIIGSSPAALTLKSSATQTAGVAAIPASYSISGNVTCERYLTGGSGYRTYRLISSPVYAATINSVNYYSINYLQNGMYLTGNAGGGFDKTGNPTLYLYREDLLPSNATFTSGNFWGISAINNSPSYNYYLNSGSTNYNIPAGGGIMVFFRGNRASASLASETLTSYTTPVAVTLSTTGSLTQGTVVARDWYTPSADTLGCTGTGTGGNYTVRGYNLVGNPYASSIDWSTFSNSSSGAAIYGSNVGPTVWTFDPTTKNYATYNAATHVATGNGSKIIASGQGFFVQAVGTSPTLTFREAAKTSTQPATGKLLMDSRVAMNNLNQDAYNSYLRLKMTTDTVNYSDAVIGFNANSPTTYNGLEDSKFMVGNGMAEALCVWSSDSVKTAAKWLPLPKSNGNLVVRLHVFAAASGQYTLERTDFNQIPALYEVWLMDRHMKDSLDIRANTNYVFDVDLNDTSTYGDNRFQVVIRENAALMVHLLNFEAVKATAGSQITWTTENEQNYTNFAVQRSTDGGQTFNVIGGFASSGQGGYSLLDPKPALGANQYRLQITDLNGNITYSNVITLMFGDNSNSLVKTGLVVYPNPAKTTLNLSIAPGFNNSNALAMANTQTTALSYGIQIVNILGAVVNKATTASQNWQTDVNSLPPGTYVIKVVNTKDNSPVGESTFIKL